ncbi:hypothetical protein MKW92_024738, partial [Papaver armeniacum]
AENIILANPQMISTPAQLNDDPYDMFNDYIIDTPVGTCLNRAAGISKEMLVSSHTHNQ